MIEIKLIIIGAEILVAFFSFILAFLMEGDITLAVVIAFMINVVAVVCGLGVYLILKGFGIVA